MKIILGLILALLAPLTFTHAETAAEKEAVYYSTLTEWHVPLGQVWSVLFKTEGDYHLPAKCDCVAADAVASGLPFCGDVVAEADVQAKVYKYGGDGDGAIWTGTYLAMLAYKWTATGRSDAEVETQMLDALSTVETLFAVSGQKGLLARSFAPPGSNISLDDGNGIHVNADDAVAYPGYRWTGNISRDQYSGIIWGLYTIERLVGDHLPGVRDRVTKLIVDFVTVLIDNGYKMPREEGKGSLSFKPILPGQAIYVLAYVRYALQLTGDSYFADAYSRLVSR
ncbi:MAG: hypothetical protein AAB425_10560, partial [Bdellovibrionota bacterium]